MRHVELVAGTDGKSARWRPSGEPDRSTHASRAQTGISVQPSSELSRLEAEHIWIRLAERPGAVELGIAVHPSNLGRAAGACPKIVIRGDDLRGWAVETMAIRR
jgi:hypothetical protein